MGTEPARAVGHEFGEDDFAQGGDPFVPGLAVFAAMGCFQGDVGRAAQGGIGQQAAGERDAREGAEAVVLIPGAVAFGPVWVVEGEGEERGDLKWVGGKREEESAAFLAAVDEGDGDTAAGAGVEGDLSAGDDEDLLRRACHPAPYRVPGTGTRLTPAGSAQGGPWAKKGGCGQRCGRM